LIPLLGLTEWRLLELVVAVLEAKALTYHWPV
jgi:hypothetical protein